MRAPDLRQLRERYQAHLHRAEHDKSLTADQRQAMRTAGLSLAYFVLAEDPLEPLYDEIVALRSQLEAAQGRLVKYEPPDGWVTPKQLAALVGTSPPNVYKKIREKKLRHVRIRGRIFIDPQSMMVAKHL
jgi:excisionase family DNA binding protein